MNDTTTTQTESSKMSSKMSSTTIAATCPQCGTETTWEAPPCWIKHPVAATCNPCENKAMEAAELQRVSDNLDAAMRCGRSDLCIW
jgi:hypothetical protein